ncbi:MAG: hypothetical protein ABSB89_04140 [Candidatus Bathyarchaeia archaeon]|jgi:hypothetical protein
MKLLSLALLVLLCTFCVVIVIPVVSIPKVHADSNSADVVTISLLLETNSDFDQLAAWLPTTGYKQFTFVIDDFPPTYAYILHNSTRVNILKTYGELIPRFDYMQQYTPAQREAQVNQITSDWITYVGYAPKGCFDFIPDTFTTNYAKSLGYMYIGGYCQDQYAVDAITEIGGWQEPYYASSYNILVPDNSTTQCTGMVVLPHATADWIDSYTVWQGLQLHPMNIMTEFKNNTADARTYFYALINDTLLDVSPVSLANIQFEWDWCVNYGLTSTVSTWIKGLVTGTSAVSAHYELTDYTAFVIWFKATYSTNPTYEVKFTSPYDSSDTIEWYWSSQYRIARVNGKVVDFVDYNIQAPDKFLTESFAINWTRPMDNDPDNCIDDSLFVTIAALGGGMLRYPAISTQEIPYTGLLADFPSTHYRQSINSINVPFIAAVTAAAAAIIGMTAAVAKAKSAKRTNKCKKSNLIFERALKWIYK